jgi:hypothetical protein
MAERVDKLLANDTSDRCDLMTSLLLFIGDLYLDPVGFLMNGVMIIS